MHGRPRKAPTPDEEKSYSLKAAKLRSLQSQFLQFHHNKNYTKEALDLNAKLLEANPEYLTAWNYRKLAVEHILNDPESEKKIDSESIKAVYDEELKVTERALGKNYKSYGAWYHRKWVLSKGYSSVDRELQLLDVFLSKDSRNFHAWNYRTFVAGLKKRSDEEELKFTTDVIEDNFSNYTAWHCRSVLLSRLLGKKVEPFCKEKILIEEYDLVHQALFTDPNDQSGWFYHLWLLNETVKTETPHLVSSWPRHNSNLYISKDSSSFRHNSGTIPLILIFSEAVVGVKSSTITVELTHCITNENDMMWTPLSTSNSAWSRAWVTYLRVVPQEKNLESLEYHQQVKVRLGHVQGIVSSSSGIHLNCPTEFDFTLFVETYGSEYVESRVAGMISWEDESYCTCETFDQLVKDVNGNFTTASAWKSKIIADEITLFRELLLESNCKIGKLTLARLLIASGAIKPDTEESVYSEVLQLYDDLISLDSPHSQYYKDERSLVLLHQLTSTSASLLKHCYQYRDKIPAPPDSCICLRLVNLSLSRFGSCERLLWVQMLDLSHNQLSSVEGLEAMRLLWCLNLSDNKIRSFSALEPLKLLQSLKVLNVSNNEIGAHPVDTTRYLCSSPFSHTVASDLNFGEFASIQDSNAAINYWGAFSVFKGLKLTQLDVIGNDVVDDEFKLFLVKIVSTLKWLDGAEV